MQQQQQRRDRLGRPFTSAMLSEPKLGKAPPNKGRTFPKAPFSQEEVEVQMRGAGRGKAGARDSCMYAFMWRTGGRVTETCKLQLSDVDLARRTIHYRYGKGSKGRGAKPRKVAMDELAASYLERWLAVRAELGVKRGAPLFCTITKGNVGHPVSPGVLRDKMRAVGERSGIDRQWNPHSWRHTCAVNMLEEGFTLVEVQTQLGHSDLATTAHYVSHLWPGQLLKKMGERTYTPGGSRVAAGAPAGVDMAELARLIAVEMLAGRGLAAAA